MSTSPRVMRALAQLQRASAFADQCKVGTEVLFKAKDRLTIKLSCEVDEGRYWHMSASQRVYRAKKWSEVYVQEAGYFPGVVPCVSPEQGPGWLVFSQTNGVFFDPHEERMAMNVARPPAADPPVRMIGKIQLGVIRPDGTEDVVVKTTRPRSPDDEIAAWDAWEHELGMLYLHTWGRAVKVGAVNVA